jgi:hypothetical protein
VVRFFIKEVLRIKQGLTRLFCFEGSTDDTGKSEANPIIHPKKKGVSERRLFLS